MNRQQREGFRRYVEHLSGYSSYGEGTKATLSIGRKAGLKYGGWKEGEKIKPGSVFRAVFERRADQIGETNVGLTGVRAEGLYKGSREPSMKIDIIWTGEKPEKRRGTFFKNVEQLAQQVAGDLGQREVYIEWSAPGRRGRVDTASPTKAPSRFDKDFCKWVRRFSKRARTEKSDGCFKR